MKRRRAVLYARVSTKKRTQERSIPRQLAELRDIARRRGWAPEWQFSDRITGGSDDRPGLLAAMDLVKSGRASVLMVHDLDRFGRDTRQLLRDLDAIHDAGGQLMIVSLNVDTSTPEGRLAFTMSAAIAEHSRRDIGRKVKAGVAYARKKGVRLGRPPAIEGRALARAVELRRRRPRPSWSMIVRQLRTERLGRYKDPTVAGAVTRELARTTQTRSSAAVRTTQGLRAAARRPRKSPPKTATKKTAKNLRARSRRGGSRIT